MAQDPAPVAPDTFRHGMRRLAAGVTIITTLDGSAPSGLTATAVTSLTVTPPHLLVCVNRIAAAHAAIGRCGRFCVNALAQEHRELAERFAGAGGIHGPERFAAGAWTTLATGAPVLADALAAFDCIVANAMDVATHTIFVGLVVSLNARDDGIALLYEAGGFGRLTRDD
jgi:flavin reductase (DIM6/NTAB) family NADH-FMN oxidoreductase RutF